MQARLDPFSFLIVSIAGWMRSTISFFIITSSEITRGLATGSSFQLELSGKRWGPFKDADGWAERLVIGCAACLRIAAKLSMAGVNPKAFKTLRQSANSHASRRLSCTDDRCFFSGTLW